MAMVGVYDNSSSRLAW